jgi:predicted PurR-regulated permease PerM
MASQARLSSKTAIWIVAVVAVLWFLQTARSLLIPIALGMLISYALEPIVGWLERVRVPRMLGAGMVMLVLLGLGAFAGYTLYDEAINLIETMPQTLERARETLFSQVGLSRDSAQKAGDALASSGGEQSGGRSLFSVAWHAVVVFFLVFFLLSSGHLVRDRLLELAGSDPDRRRTTAVIITDINSQIQRYLVVLLITGSIVGAATWAVLAFLKVQDAAMWGILAGIFNSIPYFGPVIVSGGLLVVGLAQGGGMTQALQMSGAALLITSLEGWLIAPTLMGKAERMNVLAVFIGLLLWIFLWGEVGTILAVPMLVVIKSVADHVTSLKPVGRLMAR